MRRSVLVLSAYLALGLSVGPVHAQAPTLDFEPVVSNPYDVIEGWLKPFGEGLAFGGNVGVHADSPDRIFIVQRGSTRLPYPVPSGYDGYASSIGMSTQAGEGRVWQNVILIVNRNGNVIEAWNQWDYLFERTDREPGPHRIRISPFDPQRRVWVIDESAHQIHAFSNDGSQLLLTLGEKNVSGNDQNHFAQPQDVALLPDGRILVGDGLGNARVVVYDAQGNYLTEFGEKGTEPDQLRTVHGVTAAPDGRVYVVDRDGRKILVYRENGALNFERVAVWTGFQLPLDIVIRGNEAWVSDLAPPKIIKFDTEGNRQATWYWPTEGRAGFREMHTIGIDSEGAIYGADNQLGRTLKLVPRPDADPSLLIRLP